MRDGTFANLTELEAWDSSVPSPWEADDPDGSTTRLIYALPWESVTVEDRAVLLSMLGGTLLEQARWAEAESVLRESLVIRKKVAATPRPSPLS
jgi:hypothetical protein